MASGSKRSTIKKNRKMTGQPTSAVCCTMYQLKVTLLGTKPPIWRRLLVRGDINLGLLHAVLQAAMGWTNSHLHSFVVGQRRFADPLSSEDAFDGSPDEDENKTLLGDIVPHAKGDFHYEYDFGDSWQHRVLVEKVIEPKDGDKILARCLDGARNCPPEDCGGIWGYSELLKAINDPKHAEHESMLEWIGGDFDPESFDADKINQYLHRLNSPATTEDQLRVVLMARDGHRD
jgi:hypothetical protein